MLGSNRNVSSWTTLDICSTEWEIAFQLFFPIQFFLANPKLFNRGVHSSEWTTAEEKCALSSTIIVPLVVNQAWRVPDLFFSSVTETLFIFPCQWNYRPDHCMYGSNCKGAEDEGVSILHGNRGVYHDDKQPAFKVVYDAIHDVSVESKMRSLWYLMARDLMDLLKDCGVWFPSLWWFSFSSCSLRGDNSLRGGNPSPILKAVNRNNLALLSADLYLSRDRKGRSTWSKSHTYHPISCCSQNMQNTSICEEYFQVKGFDVL